MCFPVTVIATIKHAKNYGIPAYMQSQPAVAPVPSCVCARLTHFRETQSSGKERKVSNNLGLRLVKAIQMRSIRAQFQQLLSPRSPHGDVFFGWGKGGWGKQERLPTKVSALDNPWRRAREIRIYSPTVTPWKYGQDLANSLPSYTGLKLLLSCSRLICDCFSLIDV